MLEHLQFHEIDKNMGKILRWICVITLPFIFLSNCTKESLKDLWPKPQIHKLSRFYTFDVVSYRGSMDNH